VGTHS